MGKDNRYTGDGEYEAGGELVDLAEQPEVETGASAVAVAPGSRMAVMIIVGIAALAFVYFMFFTGEEPEAEKKKAESQTRIVQNAPPVTPDTSESVAPPMPALPEPPPIAIPTPPPPPKAEEVIPMVPAPPPPPALVPTPEVAPLPTTAVGPQPPAAAVQTGESEETRQRRLARLKSGMLVVGGGGGPRGATASDGTGTAIDKEGEDGKKGGALDSLMGSKREFGKSDFRLSRTSAEQAEATLIARDMGAVVAQGKVIDAVLETAINTDIPGQLRAVISRDVYAETGKNVLLPKGSRLVGSYQAEVKRGEQRVQIIWQRAIRPDGIDIAIESPGTDQLGRSGIDGTVDNRYFELFTNTILFSTITGAAAIMAEGITGTDGVTSTTSAEGTTTQSGKPSDFAIMEGIDNLGTVTKGLADDMLKTKPTITVPQGTRIKVFVNRDLIFPSSVANNVKFVQ